MCHRPRPDPDTHRLPARLFSFTVICLPTAYLQARPTSQQRAEAITIGTESPGLVRPPKAPAKAPSAATAMIRGPKIIKADAYSLSEWLRSWVPGFKCVNCFHTRRLAPLRRQADIEAMMDKEMTEADIIAS